MLWQLFIFMEVEPFLYYFMITKTLNTSHEKNKMMRLDQYPHVMRPSISITAHNTHVDNIISQCYISVNQKRSRKNNGLSDRV